MPSIQVGRLMSKEQWDAAVKTALRAPSHSCSPLEKEAKKAFQKGDLDTALAKMPAYCHDERVLLQSLLARKSSKAAVLSMPHAKLFKLAYWSRVWNLMASERARRYSMAHAVEGDLVLAQGATDESEGVQTMRGDAEKEGRSGGGEEGRPPGAFGTRCGEAVPMSPAYLSGYTNKRGENVWRFGEKGHGAAGKAPDIHCVSAEDERQRRFSIFEVVLPVVDSEVRCVLPKNSIRKFVKKLVKKDGMGDVLKSAGEILQRVGFLLSVLRISAIPR
jgi:hypothetical protein